MNPYRQHLIDTHVLVPAGTWVDTLPCLCLTSAEREWFTSEALEWLSWWETMTPDQRISKIGEQ